MSKSLITRLLPFAFLAVSTLAVAASDCDSFVYIRSVRLGTEGGYLGVLKIDAVVLVTLSSDTPPKLQMKEFPLTGLNQHCCNVTTAFIKRGFYNSTNGFLIWICF